jgi:general secretion pathway protein M
MLEWWLQRAPREQAILAAGGGLLLLLLVYLLAWEPAYASLQRNLAARNDVRELASWLREIQPRVAGVSRSGGSRSSNRSMLATVDQSAKSSGLGSRVNRIQPEGDNTVQVWIENAPLSSILQWIQTLHEQYGIRVSNLSLDRGKASGTGDARMTLERS